MKQLLWDLAGKLLPNVVGSYNGVEVKGTHPLVYLLPWYDSVDKPDYEQSLIDALNDHVRSDDTVIIVGGGYGVTATVASRLCHTVSVFEASGEQVKYIHDTFDRNDVHGVSVHHAVVGPVVDLWGGDVGMQFDPEDVLFECDVLELDCEGAELFILKDMTIRPRCIIVETHGELGSPTSSVKAQLEDMGYSIVDEQAEVPEEDVMVLTAVQADI